MHLASASEGAFVISRCQHLNVAALMTPTRRAADDARMRTGRTASIAPTAVGVAALWVMATADPSGPPWWQLAGIGAVAAIPVALGLLLSIRRPRMAIGPLLVALSVVPLIVFAVGTWGLALGNLDFGRFEGARPRAAPRGPPAPRDHGLCSPRPWRGRLAVRETSQGMNLPGSLRRSPGAIQWIVIR